VLQNIFIITQLFNLNVSSAKTLFECSACYNTSHINILEIKSSIYTAI